MKASRVESPVKSARESKSPRNTLRGMHQRGLSEERIHRMLQRQQGDERDSSGQYPGYAGGIR